MLCSPVQTPASTHASTNKLRCTNRTGLLAHTTSDSCETVLAELGRHDHGRRHRYLQKVRPGLGIEPTPWTAQLEAELFPSGLFFPHGNQTLDMYCARARPPGSQDCGTMHCPSLGGTAMSNMHVLAMLTCMASRSPGA